MVCPVCAVEVEKLTPEMALRNDGATFDCPNCDTLLITKDNRLYEFHSHLHAMDSRWPKNLEVPCA